MKKDLFSAQANDYARYRPAYPENLYQFIVEQVKDRSHVWDVGTGNGQAAAALADFFSEVTATDPSENQIKNAIPRPNINYLVCSAEKSSLPSNSVSLVTVAQAFHWFDRELFFQEVRRVAKQSQSYLAVWCYAVATISPEVDRVVDHLYSKLLGPFWEPERRLVEDGYRSVVFPFREIPAPSVSMSEEWDLGSWLGYLKTWSALHTAIKRTNQNPLVSVESDLAAAWGNPLQRRRVSWPLSFRLFSICN